MGCGASTASPSAKYAAAGEAAPEVKASDGGKAAYLAKLSASKAKRPNLMS